eukprot:GSMAST32.ASY1.ANO1.645.1 assembled CDS
MYVLFFFQQKNRIYFSYEILYLTIFFFFFKYFSIKHVLGTLRDQVCYPESTEIARQMSEDELRSLLREVDLEYIMNQRTPKQKSIIKKQKTTLDGTPNPIIHAKFAILDECTSGVSAAMERRLYNICAKRNITCITISHRPALAKFHDVVLNILKDGKGGWTWTKTNSLRQNNDNPNPKDIKSSSIIVEQPHSQGKHSQGDDDTDSAGNALAERKCLQERSQVYMDAWEERQSSNDKKNIENQRGFLYGKSLTHVGITKRIYDVLSKFCPNGFDLHDSEVRRVLLLIGLVVSSMF